MTHKAAFPTRRAYRRLACGEGTNAAESGAEMKTKLFMLRTYVGLALWRYQLTPDRYSWQLEIFLSEVVL